MTVEPAIVRHCIHGALDFVPFWFHPDGKFPAEELFEHVADTVLLMLGVRPRTPLTPQSPSRGYRPSKRGGRRSRRADWPSATSALRQTSSNRESRPGSSISGSWSRFRTCLE